MVCNAAGSVAVGWPIYSALNAQVGSVMRWGAAALTILIGLAMLDLLITYAVRKSAEEAVLDTEAVSAGRY